MADWDDVRRLALALPDTAEGVSRGNLQWTVHQKLFVWERPLRKPDVAALGPAAPSGPLLGVRVADPGEKAARLEADSPVVFTIPHFDGYDALLVQLDVVEMDHLAELVTEAWLARAPKRLAEQFLSERR